MIKIIFESHSTTLDNENHLASGRHDAALSLLGEKQAKELGQRYENADLAAVFCSDLKRSYQTAAIAFAGREMPIIKDSRLSECDYGDLNGQPSDLVDREKPSRVKTPFPGGKSYQQTTWGIKDFLDDLRKNYDGKTVMIIGHRATQYGLEHLLNSMPLTKAISAPWQWQPGWVYILGG